MQINFKSFWQEEDGALNEFIGFILFAIFLFGLLIPSAVELFIYSNQGQELDRLTKLAAQRACSVMSNPNIGSGGDLQQGSLGYGTDIAVMQPLVNSVFQNEAARPQSYSNIEFRVFDVLGEEIDIRVGGTNDMKVNTYIGEDGSTQSTNRNVIIAGTNMDMSLCPAGGGPNNSDWKWCLNAGDAQIKKAISNTGYNTTDSSAPDYRPSDLVARMEKLQPGRCNPAGGQPCQQDFRGRIDRCTVCATKARESIFKRTIFGAVLACDTGQGSLSLLPCTMTTCANAKFIQYSAKRGYSPKYRDKMNLGGGTFGENSPHSDVDPLSTPTPPPTNSREFFCSMNKTGPKGVFENGSEYCN